MVKNKKSYPPRALESPGMTDNYALWIEGKDELEGIIAENTSQYEREIDDVKHRIECMHTKTVKGYIYWYESDGNSGHKYIGKDDPRPGLLEKIEAIKQALLFDKKEMKKCIIVPVNSHYIIDEKKIIFKRRAQNEIIPLKKLLKLSASRSSSRPRHG